MDHLEKKENIKIYITNFENPNKNSACSLKDTYHHENLKRYQNIANSTPSKCHDYDTATFYNKKLYSTRKHQEKNVSA